MNALLRECDRLRVPVQESGLPDLPDASSNDEGGIFYTRPGLRSPARLLTLRLSACSPFYGPATHIHTYMPAGASCRSTPRSVTPTEAKSRRPSTSLPQCTAAGATPPPLGGQSVRPHALGTRPASLPAWEIMGDQGRSVEIGGDVSGRSGEVSEIRGDQGRSVEIRGDQGRSGEIRGDQGRSLATRGLPASDFVVALAPSHLPIASSAPLAPAICPHRLLHAAPSPRPLAQDQWRSVGFMAIRPRPTAAAAAAAVAKCRPKQIPYKYITWSSQKGVFVVQTRGAFAGTAPTLRQAASSSEFRARVGMPSLPRHAPRWVVSERCMLRISGQVGMPVFPLLPGRLAAPRMQGWQVTFAAGALQRP